MINALNSCTGYLQGCINNKPHTIFILCYIDADLSILSESRRKAFKYYKNDQEKHLIISSAL